jgi:hypothetical protein
MRRREFIALMSGVAAVWPLAAGAQQTDRIRRIGVLSGLAKDDSDAQAQYAAFNTRALATGLGGWPQRTYRHPLVGREFRRRAHVRNGTGRACSGRDPG